MNAAGLLDTPRGRRLLWHLLEPGVGPDPSWWPPWTTEGRVATPDADLLPPLRAAATASVVTEQGLLVALAATVDHARYRQPPESLDHVLARAAVRAALAPLDADVAAQWPGWWSADLDRATQHGVGFRWDGDERVVPLRLDPASALARWREDTLEQGRQLAAEARRGRQVSGAWWSTPTPAPATTRSAAGLPAVHLALVEDESGWTGADVTPVAVPDGARVAEVHSRADWADFVGRHPFDVTDARRFDWWRTTASDQRWFLPDFVALATDFDAVHVSVAGYLDTAGRAVPVPGTDGATVLAGWNPDQTWWLTAAPSPVGPPTRWRRDHDPDSPWDWHPA